MDILAALNAAPEPPARPADAPAKARDGRDAEKTAFSREFEGVAANKDAGEDAKAPAGNSTARRSSKGEEASEAPSSFFADQDADEPGAAQSVANGRKALSAEFKAELAKLKQAGGAENSAQDASETKTADSEKKAASETKEQKAALADKAAAASAVAKSRLTVAEARRLLAENATFTFDRNGRRVLSHRELEQPAANLAEAAKEAAAKSAGKSAGEADAKDKAEPANGKHHDKKKDAAAAVANALAQAAVLPSGAHPQKNASADGELPSSPLVDALLDPKHGAFAGDIQLKSALHHQGDSAKTPLAAILAAAQPAKPDAGQMPPDIAAAINAIENHTAQNVQTAAAQQNPTPLQTAAAAQNPANQVIAAIHAGQGRGDIHVRLDPPDLGGVRIHFSLDRADGVTATVTSDRGDTLNLMRRHGDDLVRELQRAGFGRVQLDFSSSNGRNDFASQRQTGSPAGPAGFAAEAADDARLVQFIRRGDTQLDRLV